MRFGEKLCKLRKSNGYTQEKLAEKLGVSRQAVARWESGETSPDITMLSVICDTFHVSADYLLNEYDSGEDIPSEIVADCIIHDKYEDPEPAPVSEKKMYGHLIAAVACAVGTYCFVMRFIMFSSLLHSMPLEFFLSIACIVIPAFACIFNFIKFLQIHLKR